MRTEKYTLLMVAVLSGIVLSGCKRHKTMQAPPLQLPVAEVIQEDVPQWMSFVGQTYGKSDIPIPARVNGFLRSIHFKEGSFIHRGDLLYVIEPEPYAAQTAQQEATVNQAHAQLIDAQQNYDRIKPLAAVNAASQSDLDAATAQLNSAKAALAAAQAALQYTQIEQSYTRIIAPINGIIGLTEARIGDYVGPGSTCDILNTISQVDTIRVVFYIPENTYYQLHQQHKAKFDAVDLTLSDDAVYPQKGRFDFIGRAVEQGTGSLNAQVSFANPDTLLRPGQFARIRSVIDTLYQALLIPQVAVNQTQGVYSVYALDSANRVHQRIVSLGSKYKNLWVVDSGLTSGTRIITSGFHKLHEGAIVEPIHSTDSLQK